MKLILLKPNGDRVEVTNVVTVWVKAPRLEIDVLSRPPWELVADDDDTSIQLKDPNLQLLTGDLIAIG